MNQDQPFDYNSDHNSTTTTSSMDSFSSYTTAPSATSTRSRRSPFGAINKVFKSIFINRFRKKQFHGFNELSNSHRGTKVNLPVVKILIGVVLVLALAITFYLGKASDNSSKSSVNKVDVSPAKAAVTLSRNFQFPLRDDKGVEVSKLNYTIENAELRDEIIVKGQKATAVKNKTFLILNLKIANQHNKGVVVNARDYVRLSVNNNDKDPLAADIHNDPVEVQAIATKLTRIGFPINETDKNLKLMVGEINGPKQTVDIKFPDR